MIFAAGLGTRLKPLTESKPKALVEVNNKPMLEWVILRLIKFDIKSIIINVHHFADQVIDFLRSRENFNIHIEISFEKSLLDTGGGLKKAEWFFEGEKDFLVHNCDVLSDIDLEKFYLQHKTRNAAASLCVSKRKTSRYLLFNTEGHLCGWKSIRDNKTLWTAEAVNPVDELSFNGIHIISGKLLKKFKAAAKYPIIYEYLRLAKENRICAFNTSEYNWADLGRAENIESIHKDFNRNYFSYLTI